jgi:hypothetical protein
VDEFSVKYVGKDNAYHLYNALLRHYEITTDWGGTVYSGMTLKWDYQKLTCDISMPGYITNVLNKFQHDAPKHPQHTPSKYVTSIYGSKTQDSTRDETPLLSAKQCNTIQKITGSVLYYAMALDPTVRMPINDIFTEQTKATEKTQAVVHQLSDYLATHPDATIRYHKPDMILHSHSDASYLSVSHAHRAQHHKDIRPLILQQANSLNILRGCIKLPHPQPLTRTDTQTGQCALRATQVRAALSHEYAPKYQNRITDIL